MNSDSSLKLLEHFRKPRNVGILEDADGYAWGENPVNGYRTDIYIKVDDDKIVDIKFKTIGCVATIASASALSEVVKGKTLNELIGRENSFNILTSLVEEELGAIPDKNWHCLPTVVQIMLKAIKDYLERMKDINRIRRVNEILVEIDKYFKKRF